jgi:hypothetical protein
MTKAPTYLLVALLALGALAVTPQAQAAVVGVVDFSDLAHADLDESSLVVSRDGDAVREIVGAGAVGVVHLRDPDIWQLAQTTVTVFSGTDNTGESITVYNAGGTGGDFFGTFGVEPTAVANNGLVQVANHGQLFIRYSDASPPGTPDSDPGRLEWLSSADGAISMPSELPGSSSVTVTVTDADANRQSTVKDSFTGRAFSRSDVAGHDIQFTETTVNSGDFTALVNFGGGAGQVGVQDGDQVTVVFTDTDARGRQVERQATAIWRQTADGTIAFVTPDFTQAVTRVGGTGDKLATLRVEDPDLAGLQSVTVRVTSSNDAIGMDVKLDRTGAGTGEFVGQFGFTEGQTSVGRIRVASGSIVTARYVDTRSADGGSDPFTAQATWFPGPSIRFMDANFAADVTTQSTSVDPHLQVTAPSYDVSDNEDLVPVLITSGRDPLGIVIRLRETGAHTGVFDDAEADGAFEWSAEGGAEGSRNETTPGSGAFLVRNNDAVKATFDDLRASGIRVEDSLTVTTAQGGPNPGKGTIALKQCTASCTTDNPTLTAFPASGIAGIASDFIFVELRDTNLALQDASSQDTVVVRVGSVNAEPISWSTNGLDLVGGIELTLKETTATSEVFVGKFGTTDSATPSARTLPVSASDLLGAAYAYVDEPGNRRAQSPPVTGTCSDGSEPSLSAGCTLQDFSGKGVAFTGFVPYTTPRNAAVSFRTELLDGAPATTFTGFGSGFIAVTGVDRFEDTSDAANSIKVRVRSESDDAGIDVLLTERYGHANNDLGLGEDGVFVGQFSFTNGTSQSATATALGKLKVKSGDILEVSYTDPRTRTGASNVAVFNQGTTRWASGATGALTVPPSIRLNSPGTIQVADADRNLDPLQRDTVHVQVLPKAEGGFSLPLLETTPTSGVFSGELDVETGCQGGADVDACVVSGDRVAVRYFDLSSATGGTATVESSFIGLAERGGLLVLSQASYATTAATALVALTDPDLDVSGAADTVAVRIFSDSDGEGEKITLTETGFETEVFVGTFQFEANRVEGNNRTRVNSGDRVSVYYLDANTAGTPDSTRENVPVLATALWSSTATSPPTATLQAAPASGAAPLGVTFTMTAADPDGAIASYTLNFGDGTTPLSGSGSPPSTATHNYAADGTYTARLTVTDNGGLTGEATAVITVGAPSAPTISAVSPSQGLPAGGTPVTITGTGFASGATVTFGGVAATGVTVVSPTTITATTPAHAVGAVDVVVTVGSLSATRTGGFTYTDNPVTTTSSTSSTSGTSTSGTSTSGTTGPGGVPTPGQILAANQRVQVTVTREGDSNVIEFELPTSGLPATVQGVQIWRSNSPYTLVATLPSSDPAFRDGRYTDTGSEARETTRYLVTMYYGPTAALGQFTQANAPDTAQYRGTSSQDSGGDGGGLPAWAIVLIVVGILFLVVLVAILIARGRNRDAQGGAAQGYAWQETTEAEAAKDEWQPPAEVHQARCPSCGTSFTAAGTKPIVTVCPGCGKKGILR